MDRGGVGGSAGTGPDSVRPQDLDEDVLIEDFKAFSQVAGSCQSVDGLNDAVLGFKPVLSLAGADEAPASVAVPHEERWQRDVMGFV